MLLVYRQIVDVDLGPDLLEFRKDISDHTSYDSSVSERSETDERVAREQPFEVIVAGLLRRVCRHVSERPTEHREHLAKRPGTSGAQDSDFERCLHCDGDDVDGALRWLTFDMSGGRKQAKLAGGRPLDGRVR
jgi:hypothetical protein